MLMVDLCQWAVPNALCDLKITDCPIRTYIVSQKSTDKLQIASQAPKMLHAY